MSDTTAMPVWKCDNDSCDTAWSQAQVDERQTEGFRLGGWCPDCHVGTLVLAPRLNCMNGPGGCDGKVEYREALSGTGRSFPRCEAHWQDRLKIQRDLDERYPVNPPANWSPLDAGESWDEPY